MTPTNAEIVKGYFWSSKKHFRAIVTELVDDPEAVLDEAAALFDQMIPDLAYLDRPDAPMASSLFWCSAALAVYLRLKERNVDAHAFGRTMHDFFENHPLGDADARPPLEDWLEPFTVAGEASQRDAAKGEFVFEVIDGNDDLDWGMNVKSCAICHEFGKHDAMTLVPYMCSTDDIASDHGHLGLRRTGTIALGAHECDFRYQTDGEPQRLADTYSQQIRIRTSASTE